MTHSVRMQWTIDFLNGKSDCHVCMLIRCWHKCTVPADEDGSCLVYFMWADRDNHSPLGHSFTPCPQYFLTNNWNYCTLKYCSAGASGSVFMVSLSSVQTRPVCRVLHIDWRLRQHTVVATSHYPRSYYYYYCLT